MAQTKTRSTSRSGSSRRNGSPRGQTRRPARAATRSRSKQSASASSTRRRATRSPSTQPAARSTQGSSPNGVTGTIRNVGESMGSAAETVGTAAQKAKTPALLGTAAVGLAGGVALGARMLARGNTGKLPVSKRNGALMSVAKEVQHVGKEIGKTGFRVGIGDVSMEVQKGERNKDNRDSPLEVLLHGLTARRAKR